MQKRLVILLALALLTGAFAMAANKTFTLVIDPGHGGHDAGAIGAFSKEKDINLRTALAFGRYVERYCPDVKVIYTRKTDVFVTLYGRAEIANRNKADLFISIHTNSVPSGHTARGMETYTLGMHRAKDNLDVAKRENSVILVEKDYKQHYQGFDPNSSESYIIFEFMQDNNMQRSVELAKLVQRNTCAIASRPNKGVKQAGFLVLRQTSMPSCLIELGFISTPAEERMLNDATSIDNIARGIYQAFTQYRGKNAPLPPSMAPVPEKEEPVVEQKPAAEAEETTISKAPNDEATVNVAPVVEEKPVFRVQILASPTPLRLGDPRFKGERVIGQYKEGGIMKYTIGESTNYNEINRLRKSLQDKFPDCFIIAHKGNEKMNINEAIREFKANKR